MVAARPTATSATSASVTDAGSRRSSSSSGTSRWLESTRRRRCPTARGRPRPAARDRGTPPPGPARARTSRPDAGPAARRPGRSGCRRPCRTPAGSRRARPLMRRSVSASATPIDWFGKDWDRSQASAGIPSNPANRCHTSSRPAAGSSTSDVDPLLRNRLRPAFEHEPQVERPPVPDVRRPVRHPPGVVGHRRGRAVLEALLPARREQPERLARRDDDVDLGVQVSDHRAEPAPRTRRRRTRG